MARILICDDAPDLRMVIRLTLEMEGHLTTEADSGVEALRCLAADPIDLVVLDVQMPRMDGWGVLRTMRADPELTAVPVVLCTVKINQDDLVKAWSSGCDGYLGKPFDLAELSDIVTRILARSPEERSALRDHNLALLRSDTSA